MPTSLPKQYDLRWAQLDFFPMETGRFDSLLRKKKHL